MAFPTIRIDQKLYVHKTNGDNTVFQKRVLQRYSKCYCVANVTKTLELKGVQTVYRSMDTLYAFKCNCKALSETSLELKGLQTIYRSMDTLYALKCNCKALSETPRIEPSTQPREYN
jgi:hypothetical protein